LKNAVDYIGDKSEAHPKLRALLCLVLSASLEGVRLRLSDDNKWYNLLGFVSYALAELSGNEFVRGFARGYYGTTILIHLGLYIKKNYIDKDSDYSSDEEDKKVPDSGLFAAADFNHVSLVEKCFYSMIQVLTDLKDACTIRNICLAVVSYKTIVNGGSFVIDSICNLLIDLVNKLGEPFGLEIFKKAYSKYPSMYGAIDCFNELKVMIEKNEVPSRMKLLAFDSHIS
jgi:hypothetical protein